MTPSSSTEGAAGHRPVRFLVFGASLRAESLNVRLAQLASTVIEERGGIVDRAVWRDFNCPPYDQDEQTKTGLPTGAQELCRRVDANDALVIAAPEYNASFPGELKNAIDWASRRRPQPFNERHALLLSASPSMVGGNRGLWALRIPLEHLGARVFPDMFSLAQAHQAYDAAGGIADAELARRFVNTIVAFMDLADAAKNYPCAKKAWVEFLGEHPTALTDREE